MRTKRTLSESPNQRAPEGDGGLCLGLASRSAYCNHETPSTGAGVVAAVFTAKFWPAVLMAWAILSWSAARACEPIDYTALPLPAAPSDTARTALRLAYPALHFSEDGDRVSADGGTRWLPLSPPRQGAAPRDLLENATPLEQFTYPYPLGFDLAARRTPWNDPGRLRSDAFFRMLYSADAAAVRASLVTVELAPLAPSRVHVTSRHGVACQLAAARDALAARATRLSRFFTAPGGGFNWRRISGTDRLSPHAFGIAIDINPALGGYWKWSGASEGAVGDYANVIPPELVQAMERYGFIWGGKWHHYDGMHFEFRPEIILYSRLKDQE
jgi:D-alanyl-D-alanine carboxypeptidase